MSDQAPVQPPQKGQIDSLRRIVEQLRLNLYSLEEQAAFYGPLDTPIHVRNAIAETTELLEQREAELANLHLHQGNVELQNSALKKFWEPFISEGADILVPHEDVDTSNAGTRVKVLALTMQGAFNMYRLLVEQFVDTLNTNRIRVELAGAIKTDANLERLAPSTFPHLIVIGAPGAHPASNYFMHQFKGLTVGDKNNIVRRGYVFRVSGEYLGSPFIISDTTLKHYLPEEQEAMQQSGIYDLTPGQPPKYFRRNFEQYGVPGFKDHDCAIIVTGWATLPGQNQIRRVVIIAGHSRHSTLFGTAFVATNEQWAQQVNALKYHNTETIIGLEPDPSGEAVAPSILAPPREIYKQA